MRRYLIVTLSILLCVLARGSAPRKGTFLMYQPDGTSFTARLKGDEFLKVLTTAEGHAVVKGADGYYCYATFRPDGSRVSSGYRVGAKTPSATLDKSLAIPWITIRARATRSRGNHQGVRRPRMSTRATTPVKKHCVVLLAQFPDLSFTGGETRRTDFENLIKKEGNKSVLDYFNDQFQGQYEFDFTIGPIVTLSKNHDYYGKNDDDVAGEDMHPQELVKEACLLSDPMIDFSIFDDDGDGVVDNVFVIVAGKSEAEGADSDYMWPHQWIVSDLVLDGKRVFTYALSTELTVQSQKSSGQLVWGLCSIGTFCHEYSHVLGLDDYYDTDEEKSGGMANGMWEITALMDGGNFNDAGRTPPSFNALDREILGIGKPEEMKLGKVTLEPVSENGRYIILENPQEPNEFFLFECRARKGWDAFIGGEGLVIYHVDMSGHEAGFSDEASKVVTAEYRWQNNEINCNPDHECADMIESSNDAIDVRQAFFPFKTINSFSPNSRPAFKFNDGTESPFAISGITRSGDNVTFTVYNSDEIVPKAIDPSMEVYQDAAILTWSSDVEGYDGEAVVSWGKSSGSLTDVTVSPYEKGKYSVTLEGLSPTTAYSVNIAFQRSGVSGEKVALDFLTKAAQTGGRPYIYLEYLASSRTGGKFPKGVGLPLRVFNAIGEKVSWSYDGVSVQTDGSGYFHPDRSGTLKATIRHSDGSQEILSKEITIQ
ncbi:MAG: M6 family metalloprotease domain-containing protein [Bacteroidales bacterium]|nr:M6 family metalloprotease domain-containing protein [Bacteroidales bacterium]